MDMQELEYKESVLRECFKEKLAELNVDGNNDMCTVKCVKTYGALWHYTHQLLLAEKHESTTTSADTMEIKATGLRMAKE
ncbi:MAG: hypothetical protein J6Y02_03750 [Pseudobutyrivibrio sp.]|nr:hypothetical protein [Pseudobutyrivibrio sp.]